MKKYKKIIKKDKAIQEIKSNIKEEIALDSLLPRSCLINEEFDEIINIKKCGSIDLKTFVDRIEGQLKDKKKIILASNEKTIERSLVILEKLKKQVSELIFKILLNKEPFGLKISLAI